MFFMLLFLNLMAVMQKGEQILLQRMLTRRFGKMPDWAEKRLLQASPEQLEHWADQLLDASTLDSVFNG